MKEVIIVRQIYSIGDLEEELTEHEYDDVVIVWQTVETGEIVTWKTRYIPFTKHKYIRVIMNDSEDGCNPATGAYDYDYVNDLIKSNTTLPICHLYEVLVKIMKDGMCGRAVFVGDREMDFKLMPE